MSSSAVALAAAAAAGALAALYVSRRQRALPQPPSASAKGWHCRAARAADVPAVHALIVELARFEQAEDEVNLSVAQLRADFDAGRYECLVVEPEVGGAVVGFALVFHTYSTWEGTCLYLEDLFVLEHARGSGAGLLLLRQVARLAAARSCGRLCWQALSWNSKAMDFYKSDKVGARERIGDDGTTWVNFIMERDAIAKLAG